MPSGIVFAGRKEAALADSRLLLQLQSDFLEFAEIRSQMSHRACMSLQGFGQHFELLKHEHSVAHLDPGKGVKIDFDADSHARPDGQTGHLSSQTSEA